MKKFAIIGTILALAAVGAGTLLATAPGLEPSASTINIVERAGYFETHGNIYNREAGPVVFEIDNKSGKNAGFVLTREGEKPLVVGVENGKSGRLEVDLKPGSYEYFCPIIPTAKYPLTVK